MKNTKTGTGHRSTKKAVERGYMMAVSGKTNVNHEDAFPKLLFSYIKKRFFITIVAVIIVIFFSLYFLLHANKSNFQMISEAILTYTGLLAIFYAYIMQLHYKELHQIAIETNYHTESSKRFKRNFEHNEVMIYLSFSGIAILLVSGILDILNLNLGLQWLLDISISLIFLTSIGILVVLWYVTSGKVADAKRKIKRSAYAKRNVRRHVQKGGTHEVEF